MLPESLDGPVTYLGLENITQNTGEIEGNVVTEKPADIKSLKNVFKPRDILYGKLRPNLNKVWLADRNGICSTDIFVIEAIEGTTDPALYTYLFRSARFNDAVMGQLKGAQLPRIGWLSFAELQIPLPPLEVQKEIVAEIEGYQKVINGARKVLDHYRPHIPIHPDWPMVELGEICDINPDTVSPTLDYPGQTVFYVDISAVENETGRFLGYTEVLSYDAPSRARRGVQPKDILLSTVRPNLKAFTILRQVRERTVVSTGFAVLRAKLDLIDPGFLFEAVRLGASISQMVGMSGRGAYPSINQSDVAAIKIPLPPLATQQTIVAEIEAEQSLVAANRELIARFEQKIQVTLARIWGEDEPVPAEAYA